MPYGVYGSPAPYEEAQNAGRARLSTMQRIAMALAGAGQGIAAVRPGVGPLGSALTGFSRGYILSNAAERAAQDYAMKQQEAEERRRSREIDDAYTTARTEAMAKEKPEPPPKTPTNVLDMDEDQFDLYMKRQAMLKAATRPPAKESKPAKTPAPPKPRAAVMGRIDSINGADLNDPNQRAILWKIVDNPPTPEEKEAAFRRLQSWGSKFQGR